MKHHREALVTKKSSGVVLKEEKATGRQLGRREQPNFETQLDWKVLHFHFVENKRLKAGTFAVCPPLAVNNKRTKTTTTTTTKRKKKCIRFRRTYVNFLFIFQQATFLLPQDVSQLFQKYKNNTNISPTQFYFSVFDSHPKNFFRSKFRKTNRTKQKGIT